LATAVRVWQRRQALRGGQAVSRKAWAHADLGGRGGGQNTCQHEPYNNQFKYCYTNNTMNSI
jgi:hypothetical protein